MRKDLLLAGAALAMAAPPLSAQDVTPANAAPTTGTEVVVEAPASDVPQASNATPTATDTAATATAPAADVAPAEGTIAAAVVANPQLSTLGAALTSAELTSTLGGAGPFTVFAPTNEAFNLIPAATREQLMQPAYKTSLQTILKYHVVAGNITAAQLRQQIEAGGGTATLQTVAGQPLRASLEGQNIVLTGSNNSKAYISTADVVQTNGTVHVINGILVPGLG